MRFVLWAVIVTGLGAIPSSAFAGVYTTDEPLPAYSPRLEEFLFNLSDYQSVDLPQSPRRKYYLDQIALLEVKERNDLLGVDDRINLSAYYIRLREYEKAVNVLKPFERATPPNFMALSNLATASQGAGRLDRAQLYLKLALDNWPTIWPGIAKAQLNWFCRAEHYYLRLLQSRQKEEARPPAKTSVDELFPGVRFVTREGQYRPGEVTPAAWAELPFDALWIVEQLLIWMPGDQRLSWLFGELLNANGDVGVASMVFNRLVEQGVKYPELREHRQILNDAKPSGARWTNDLTSCAQVFWLLFPRGATLPPGAASVALESGPAAFQEGLRQVAKKETVPQLPSKGSASAPEPQESKLWLPDLRHIIVSFVAGVLVTLLGTMQVREIRRRHQSAAPTKSSV